MKDEDTRPPIPPTTPTKGDEPDAPDVADAPEAPEGEGQAAAQPTNADFIKQIAAKVANSENILVALSRNPSVDEIASAVGLALFLEEAGKHVTAIYSGETPNVLEFLKPEETFEDNTDSLQDFIIALSKEKADHLRYKVDGDYVKVFVTPYKVKIDQDDLEFSHGDYNVDLVIALNVPTASDLDAALSEHGRIMHDASAIDITTGEPGRFGEIEWSDPESSSVGEMVANLLTAIKKPEIAPAVATALLAGMMAATNRFASENTKSTTMTMAAKLMELGADQQLVAMNVMENSEPELIGAVDIEEAPSQKKIKDDKTLLMVGHENEELEGAIKEAAEEATAPEEIKSDAVAKAPAEEAPEAEVAPENTETAEAEAPVAETPETPVVEASAPEVSAPEAPAPEAPEIMSEESPAMPEVVEPTPEEAAPAEPAPAEPTPAEPMVAPEEPKPEIESSAPSAAPDYSQMMSEALAESIPEGAAATPMPIEPITSGPASATDDSKKEEKPEDELESPEMASEPAALQDDSYVFNQSPKVVEPLPDLPPPPLPPIDFGATPSDQPALPQTPGTIAGESPVVMPPVDITVPEPTAESAPGAMPAVEPTPEEPVTATPAAGNALEQLQQMAAPAQEVEAPALPPIESVPGAIPGTKPSTTEPATELTPDVPPQPMNGGPAAPDAFQIPNVSQ